MNPSLNKDELVLMLYLLMRDAAPTGEIVQIVGMVADCRREVRDIEYTSKELQAYAQRLADKLLA